MPMSNFFEEEVSDGENDDALLAEIQAISGACLPSSSKTNSDGDGAAAENPIAGGTTASSDFSDSDDDFELLRRIQQQYGGGGKSNADAAEERLMSPKPIIALPPMGSDSDDDDDFNTLCAIQKRFGQYCSKEAPNSGGNQDDPFLNLFENRTLNGGLGGGGSNRIDANEEDSSGNAADGETLGFDNVSNPNFFEMPQWALAFHDAIKKNRLLQKHLRNKMMCVEARMAEISGIRKRVQTLVEYHVQCKRKVGQMLSRGLDDRIQLISSPETSSALSFGLPENSRVVNYRMAFKVYPQSFPKEKWSRKESENLKKGILQQFQNRLLQKSMNLLNVSEGPENVEVDQVMSLIGKVEMTPENIRSFLPKVDWDLLASTYVPRRSGLECQARWLNYEDPLINWGKWTHLEDKSLLYIIQQKGMNNWIDKAISLGTNRTPYQCLARYQRSLNASLIKRDWTADEDAKLISAVESFGESNWEVVASCLEGRTGPQCSNRWLKTLHPSKQKKGRWSPDEDKRLTIAVKVMGCNNKNWYKIAQFVPGRTQARCRERWMNCLDPDLKFSEWTEEDDLKLKEAIQFHGFRWSKVALCVPPRTDNQCRRRWAVLFPDDFCQLQLEREVKRKALPANFVDREPNRPSLGASDFEPLPLVESTAKVHSLNVSQRRKRKLHGRKVKGPLKTVDTAIFNIPRKPRSREGRKISNYLENLSSQSGSLSQRLESNITLSSGRERANSSAVEQNKRTETGQSPSLSSSSELILQSSKKVEKEAVQKRKKRVINSCVKKKKNTKCIHDPISLCRESCYVETEMNQSSTSDITLLSLMKKASGADQRKKRSVRGFCVAQKKQAEPVHGQFSYGQTGDKASGEFSTEELMSEKSGTCSGNDVDSCGVKESVLCRSKISGKKQKKRRLNSVETEEWEHLTMMELLSLMKKASGADERKKGRVRGFCVVQKKQAEPVHGQLSYGQIGNKAAGEFSTEELMSERLDTSSGNNFDSCGEKESVLCRSKISRKKQMKRKLNSVEI